MKPTTNNLEGWREDFDEKFIDVDDDDLRPLLYAKGINREDGLTIPTSWKVKQFISDLRKHDMEELIKMLPKEIRGNIGGRGKGFNECLDWIKQLIKDYYEK